MLTVDWSGEVMLPLGHNETNWCRMLITITMNASTRHKNKPTKSTKHQKTSSNSNSIVLETYLFFFWPVPTVLEVKGIPWKVKISDLKAQEALIDQTKLTILCQLFHRNAHNLGHLLVDPLRWKELQWQHQPLRPDISTYKYDIPEVEQLCPETRTILKRKGLSLMRGWAV